MLKFLNFSYSLLMSIHIFISDDAKYYHLTGSKFGCDFFPNLQPSNAIDLATCIQIDTAEEEEQDVLFVFRVLHQVKRRDIKVKFKGLGIECNPVNGVVMTAISTVGTPVPCKTFVGRLDTMGSTICSYSCSCSSGCVMFRAAISDPANKAICVFVV